MMYGWILEKMRGKASWIILLLTLARLHSEVCTTRSPPLIVYSRLINLNRTKSLAVCNCMESRIHKNRTHGYGNWVSTKSVRQIMNNSWLIVDLSMRTPAKTKEERTKAKAERNRKRYSGSEGRKKRNLVRREERARKKIKDEEAKRNTEHEKLRESLR